SASPLSCHDRWHHPALPSFPTRRSSDLYHEAPEELLSIEHPDPTWADHYNWVQQRLLIANLRGGDRPQDIVVKVAGRVLAFDDRSEEHTSELQSRENLVCRLLLEKKKSR